jgi:chloramphenicol-sensitive protein RarD
MPVYWKLLTHVPALETLMHRIIWSFVFYAIIILARGFIKGGYWRHAVPKREWLICIACSLLMSINWGVFVYAVNIERVVEASLAYFINPLMNVAVGVVLFREAFPKLLKVAFILATIGVMIQIGFCS